MKEWQKWYILSFQGTKSISVKHGLALEKIDVNPVSDIILAAPKLISPAFVSAELACSSLHISHFKSKRNNDWKMTWQGWNCNPEESGYKDAGWVVYIGTDTDVHICGPKYSWQAFLQR